MLLEVALGGQPPRGRPSPDPSSIRPSDRPSAVRPAVRPAVEPVEQQVGLESAEQGEGGRGAAAVGDQPGPGEVRGRQAGEGGLPGPQVAGDVAGEHGRPRGDAHQPGGGVDGGGDLRGRGAEDAGGGVGRAGGAPVAVGVPGGVAAHGVAEARGDLVAPGDRGEEVAPAHGPAGLLRGGERGGHDVDGRVAGGVLVALVELLGAGGGRGEQRRGLRGGAHVAARQRVRARRQRPRREQGAQLRGAQPRGRHAHQVGEHHGQSRRDRGGQVVVRDGDGGDEIGDGVAGAFRQ